MASIFKQFQAGDIASTRTLLHESLPITGTLWSGSTYQQQNIKNYSHGLYQSVFDFPFLSSSANHICDITVGYAPSSIFSSSTSVQNAQKINIYNQFAQVLMGYDITGTIQLFDEDGNIAAGGNKIREAYFLNFSRLLAKDEIKKGSVNIILGMATSSTDPHHSNGGRLTITDVSASTDFKVNSPIGEYGVLSASLGGAYIAGAASGFCGLVFYQAGIMVLTSSIFQGTGSTAKLSQDVLMSSSNRTMTQMLTGSSISSSADAFRQRVYDISFNNTTELNSTHYFCRINHNEFNYSANPTYLSGSKMVVKNNRTDAPLTYITEVLLYSDDGELMAVAKVSEPIKKTPENTMVLRIRTDW